MVLVSTSDSACNQVSKRLASGRPRSTIQWRDRRVWYMAVAHRIATAAEIRAAIETIVTMPPRTGGFRVPEGAIRLLISLEKLLSI